MLIDGINLVEGSSIINSHAESGTSFPSSATSSPGRMFYLSATSGGNDPGLYVWNGTIWVTGDVTKVITGTGLTGGGSGGDVNVAVDTTVIATISALNSAISTVSGGTSTSLSTLETEIGTKMPANQTFTYSGDVTGSGNTSTALTLINTGVAAGSFGSATAVPVITVDAKGRVTSASTHVITPAFSSITNTPTTFSGYGITDVQPINSNLTAVANLTQNGIVVKTAGTTATIVTVTGSAGRVTVANGDGTTGNPTIDLAASGVGAGTYKSVTVDSYGRVTGGSNPSTISGYGISDAVNKTGDSMSGSLVIASGAHITLNDLPVNSTDATNKAYVDSAIAGLSWKAPAKVAAGSNITLSGYQTIDNIAVVAGDRVLVIGQTDPTQNGVYVVSASAWTRSTDANTQAELEGLAILVEQGVVYTNAAFVCSNTGTLTFGTTAISFIQFNGASGVIAGTGLTKNGNTLHVAFGAGMTELPSNDIGINLYTNGGLILTTDGSTSSVSVAAQLALANTGVAGGSYNTVTVDVHGRVTAGSNTAYLTGNQNIVVSGDATGSGATAIALTLAASGVTAGTYKSVTVDTKGRVTAGTNPTTLAGYGITDAMQVGVTIDGGSF